VKDLLGRAQNDILVQLAHAHVLLAFDFDGTLAPIVEDREGAEMRESTRRLFARLGALYPTAVISGRSQRDVSARIRGLGVKYVIGNHGLEPGDQIAPFEAQVKVAAPLLMASLSTLAGVEVEDKRYSLAVHYRRARQKGAARKAILAAVAALPSSFRVVGGKLVMNLVPSGAAHKGDAVLDLRRRESADTAFYVGDDVTDEDVFALDQPGRLLTARVGMSKTSAAGYFLRGQRQIDTLLERLVEYRARGTK
jgi:trehalose 6-phosphate phosphatase